MIDYIGVRLNGVKPGPVVERSESTGGSLQGGGD